MIFTIGRHAYTVRMALEPLYDDSGDECWALCDPITKELILSPAMPPDARLGRLRHEFYHAWLLHHPTPMDEESQAIVFATAGDEFQGQYDAQGGLRALLALRATGKTGDFAQAGACPMREPKQSIAPMLADRIECGGCGATIMCGSFIDSPAQYMDDLKAWTIRRAAPCDACGCVTTWWELASEHGRPLGSILQVQTPRVLRGNAAREFFYSRDNAASNC